jgi:putative Mg2+ transporter-C (MgtC) family protein
MMDLGLQFDLTVRLILSAVFGAAIGLEREVHGHPAGIRTHLLVSLGAALFTVLSIYGFSSTTSPVDPSRVAAQIVSGIGFLGAGAILKEGLSIRGLTTAASLWATAAVGLAAGAGQQILAAGASVIIIFSLWPLSLVVDRLRGLEKQLTTLRLTLDGMSSLADVLAAITLHRVEIVGLRTEHGLGTSFEVEVDVRVRSTSDLPAALDAVTRINSVHLQRSSEM